NIGKKGRLKRVVNAQIEAAGSVPADPPLTGRTAGQALSASWRRGDGLISRARRGRFQGNCVFFVELAAKKTQPDCRGAGRASKRWNCYEVERIIRALLRESWLRHKIAAFAGGF